MAGPMLAAVILAVLAVAPSKPARSDLGEAKRLYTLGERNMTEGRAPEAVSLWRHAILLVPATADYDQLRHDLVMRLGYGLLAAHHATKDRRYLVEAQRMLLRYVERHEKLVGDHHGAKAERDEAYEQLYEIESRLAEASEAESASEPLPPTDPLPETRPRTAKRDSGGTGPSTITEGGEVHVHTDKRETPKIEDPKIRRKLASRETDPETGLWLTRTNLGLEAITGPRPYVRVYGAARPLVGRFRPRDQPARQALVVGTIRSVRDALLTCYASAYARDPDKNVVLTELELSIAKDGTVRHARITGDAVVDDRGSRCVARHLGNARAPSLPDRAHRIRVPVVFFWQSERPSLGMPGSGKKRMGRGFDGEMPPIDAPAVVR
jgi:hypothetical protein